MRFPMLISPLPGANPRLSEHKNEAFVRFWVAKKHKIGYNDNYEILCNFAGTFFGIEDERTQARKINYKLGRFRALHIRK